MLSSEKLQPQELLLVSQLHLVLLSVDRCLFMRFLVLPLTGALASLGRSSSAQAFQRLRLTFLFVSCVAKI
jgi:hypothetical protein